MNPSRDELLAKLPTSQILIVGGGKMGEALMAGWIESAEKPVETLSSKNFTILEPNEERRAYHKQKYQVETVAQADNLQHADIVVLAVKPQIMISVIQDLPKLPPFTTSLYISIAAGIQTDSLVEVLPEESSLVRVMPNLPLVVGEGASAVCGSVSSNDEEVTFVCDLFGCLGFAEEIEETLMDAVCAISGSGPAYVAAMIESLTKAGVEQGLSESLAENLALQTVYGTAKQLKLSGESPAALRKAVSSPGGTTLAGLDAMKTAGLDEVYSKGVASALRRAKELATCKA